MVVLPPLTPRTGIQGAPGLGPRAAALDISKVPGLTPRPLGRAALPTSVTKATSGPQPESVQTVFKWTAIQDKMHARKTTLVDTLAMDIASETFLNQATSSVLQIDRHNFEARQPVWVYLVGGTFVVCKGHVHCRAKELPAVIARLPAGMYPPRPLYFCALARQIQRDEDSPGTSTMGRSTLVTLLARPDGLIMQVAGSISDVLDISAIRFSTDKGILLVDEVSLHVVDVAKTRLVTLQGKMRARSWAADRKSHLARLPSSCRPPRDLNFIGAGDSSGGFVLLRVHPTLETGEYGHGGEIHWLDSIWLRERIHLSGIAYEVHPSALGVAFNARTKEVAELMAEKILQNFRKRIANVYSTLEHGASSAFGLGGDREINFEEFAAGCKLIGYGWEVTKLWDILDEDRSGGISIVELTGEDEAEATQILADDTIHGSRRASAAEVLERIGNRHGKS